ncbi:hypothetical protein [Cryobacterium sp. CG_9.6]|uniref:hypothetical protein n=1 Tax=Cryobacterium sp. CG_9.6 TaxID=2760710 RepID=UPI0024733263|nr:hypothetical protein [Cryobacterium sp. CG_9.6]MDH6237376.1 hypothetical protein [Cryobacterium sp. CG_9.6]
MTLGNSQPPLTRRQAREAALALEQHSGAAQPLSNDIAAEPDVVPNTTATSSDAVVPSSESSARKPRLGHKRRTDAAKADQSKDSTAPAVVDLPDTARPDTAPPMTSFAPRSGGSGAASAVPQPSLDLTGRTLTRRELRALNAAEAADVLDFESEAAKDKIVPRDRAVKAPTPSVSPSAVRATTAVAAAATAVATDVVDAEETVSTDTNTLNPPVGHWSIDKGEDEAPAALPLQSLDDLMSLGVGAGGIPTTTNALILPSIPNQGTSSGPFSNTGEILITGSFDLPRSLGETGQHPNHFDSSDVDQMNEPLDDIGLTDNAPVSASRAISTHASTRNVMTPPKKGGVTLPVVLVVSTAALAVSVSALLFVGHLLQIF